MSAPAPRNPTPAAKTVSILLFCFTLLPLRVAASVAHEMLVEVSPHRGEISVQDRVTTTRPVSRFEFVLNAGFDVEARAGRLQILKTSDDGLRRAYRVTLETAATTLELHYRGQPVFSRLPAMGGMPRGVIADRAVYLDGASAWYPLFDGPILGLDMQLKLPEGWRGISIGKSAEKDGIQRWTTDKPHDDIYLVAGRYAVHRRRHGDIDVSVWLLQDDRELAGRYLGPTAEYIDHYSDLIGAYPYAKFAVVENPWQTGYGMPSFTLLGSRVIRLPFIPFTSLPHEILHNWWGNGVWVDHARGNWSEGLTAYLADHWMQERRGKGAGYRLKALQRYSNFAADGQDMPLTRFVSRHNDASQSVGYSKSLMLFHMLRRAMGDQAFVAGLRRAWQTLRFQPVGFTRFVATLVSDPALASWSRQWLEREGAPRLRLGGVAVEAAGAGYRLTFEIRQEGGPFHFDLPFAVTLDGAGHAARHQVAIDGAREEVALTLPSRPLRLDIDPEYDVLRYLDPSEQPPALNRLFGAPAWLVLPSAADAAEKAAWRDLAAAWRQRYPQLTVLEDDQADALPRGANRLIAGWQNRLFEDAATALQRPDQQLLADGAVIAGARHAAADHDIVLLNNAADGTTTGFVGAASAAGVRALARKLPHYGSYGRLVFDTASGRNLRKDTLTSAHSTLTRQLGDRPVALRLAPRAALTPTEVTAPGNATGRQEETR